MKYSLYLPVDVYGGIFTFFLSVIEILELKKNSTLYVNESISVELLTVIEKKTQATIKKIPGTKLKNNIIKRFIAAIYLTIKKEEGTFIFIDFNPILDFIALFWKKKLIAFSHTVPKRKLHMVLRRSLSTLINVNSVKIIAVSKYQMYELKEKYYLKDTPIEVIHNHSRLTGDNRERKLEADRINISTVAHCVEYKGVYEWIEMAKHFSTQNNKLYFTWYGDGELLESSRKKVVSHDNINFVGYITDISGVLSKTDIYIQLSKIENLSISVLDAMNYSIPSIVTDVGGMNELISNGINGYIVHNLIELNNQLNALIQDNGEYIKMSKNTKEIYDEMFSFKRWKEQIIELLGRG